MDGFELAAKNHAEKNLSKLPVILLTALKFREPGMDAGTDSFIFKNSFDQSNLLETIGRSI